MKVMKNRRYLKQLQSRKRKSYNDLLHLVLKRESFIFDYSKYDFFKDIFTSCSRWKSKTTFILANCKNSPLETLKSYFPFARQINCKI